MKKISIFLLAAMAMISCGNSYKAQDATLTNESDSVNYAIGLVNGLQIKSYYLENDSSDEAVAEFIDALELASVKEFEKKGLAENEAWTLNEKIFFQGLVNAFYEDSSVITPAAAEEFFMKAYQAKEEGKADKPITAKCPKKAKTVKLKSHNDSKLCIRSA